MKKTSPHRTGNGHVKVNNPNRKRVVLLNHPVPRRCGVLRYRQVSWLMVIAILFLPIQ